MKLIELCVREVSRSCLDLKSEHISIIEPTDREEALRAYSEHMACFGGPVKLVFTEEDETK